MRYQIKISLFFEVPISLTAEQGTISIENSPDAVLTQVAAGSRGQGGDVIARAQNIQLLTGSRLVASTAGNGDAGNIAVSASEAITLSDAITGFYATAEAGSRGDRGSINVEAPIIDINNAARISITVEGFTQGNRGDVRLTADRALLLRNQGLIETDAGGEANGGNILITTPFLIGLPDGNSDIIANALAGSGGNIEIQANAILNFDRRDNPDTNSLINNRTNDISASSEFGSSGVLDLAGLDIDPSQGTAQLPAVPTPDNQVDQTCSTKNIAENRFTVTGRNGLPLSPNEPLSSHQVQTRWVSLPDKVAAEPFLLERQRTTQLREAISWKQDPTGKVLLFALEQAAPDFPTQSCQIYE